MKIFRILVCLFLVHSCIASEEVPSESKKAPGLPNSANQSIINQAINYLDTCVANRQMGSWMYLVVPSNHENIATLITTAAANRLDNDLLSEEDTLTEARLRNLIDRANQRGHNADNIGSYTAAFTHFINELAYRAVLHILLQQGDPNANDQHFSTALARILDRHTPPPPPPSGLLNLDTDLLAEIAPHLLNTEEDDSNVTFPTQHSYTLLFLISLLAYPTIL